jgi:hypothetical protein
LNTPHLVSPELRDRIAQATQALNWVPNGVAKALAFAPHPDDWGDDTDNQSSELRHFD